MFKLILVHSIDLFQNGGNSKMAGRRAGNIEVECGREHLCNVSIIMPNTIVKQIVTIQVFRSFIVTVDTFPSYEYFID